MATPIPNVEETESGVDLAALWRPIRKHWITVIMIAVLVTVAAAFYTTRQTKIYQATATVMFDPNPPRPLGGKVESVVEMGSGAVWDTREYYETQYEVITSRKVSLGVVQQRGLNRDAAFLLNLPPHAVVPANFEAWDEGDAADVLRSRLRVEPVKNSLSPFSAILRSLSSSSQSFWWSISTPSASGSSSAGISAPRGSSAGSRPSSRASTTSVSSAVSRVSGSVIDRSNNRARRSDRRS